MIHKNSKQLPFSRWSLTTKGELFFCCGIFSEEECTAFKMPLPERKPLLIRKYDGMPLYSFRCSLHLVTFEMNYWHSLTFLMQYSRRNPLPYHRRQRIVLLPLPGNCSLTRLMTRRSNSAQASAIFKRLH